MLAAPASASWSTAPALSNVARGASIPPLREPAPVTRSALLLPLALVVCGGPRSQQDAPAPPPNFRAGRGIDRHGDGRAAGVNASYAAGRLRARHGRRTARAVAVRRGQRASARSPARKASAWMAWCCCLTIPPAARHLYFEDAQRNAGHGAGARVRPGSRWRLTTAASARRCRTSCAATAGRSASSGWIGITAATSPIGAAAAGPEGRSIRRAA